MARHLHGEPLIMKRLLPIVLLAVLGMAAMLWQTRQDPASTQPERPAATRPSASDGRAPFSATPLPVSALPDEARDTLRTIRSRGPFPHRQDGQIFHNRERLLPLRERGWYREYTVSTPGADDRGARRIVTGGDPPAEFWYTRDHYRSFQRIDIRPGTLP